MKKLLFIDDEKPILEELKSYFKENFDVYTASNYAEAMMFLTSIDFDCVISDVNLNEFEGFDIVKFVKEFKSKVPVLLLSGLTEEEMILRGFECGADDYIRKPFSLPELNARILVRLGKNEKPIYRFGDLEINAQNSQASFKGKPIVLTSMEFDILLLLAKNAGTLLSKEDIYNEIWKQAPLVQMHTLQVHMFTLRKKMQMATNIEYIKTVWKKGYIFEAQENDKK